MQSRQSGANGTGKSSRPFTNQIIACSFRSNRGRVAGQHAHGFLMVCCSVETKQNPWYSNGTQSNENLKRLPRCTRKKTCFLQASAHLHNHDATLQESWET